MKLFGKWAGREQSRPALSRSGSGIAAVAGSGWGLGEEAERYRVVVTRGDGGVRTAVIGEPVLIVGADERAGGPAVVAVSMLGTNGESTPVTISL